MEIFTILLGFVLAFIGAGMTVTLSPSFPWEFWIARVCFISTALICAGYSTFWLVGIDKTLAWRLALGGLIGAILAPSTIAVLMWVNFRADLAAPDILVPDNVPSPPMPFTMPGMPLPPKDAFFVYFGTNVAWFNKFPHNILIMKDQKMLVIDKDNSGNIVVSILRIFDDNNNIVARIEYNGFWIAGSTRKKRPNKSQLVVYDHNDDEVLNIKMINKNSITLAGIFRKEGCTPVLINENYLDIGYMKLKENIYSRSINADIFIR